MAGKYVVNGELTAQALMTPELMDKCTFTVGSDSPVNIKDDTTTKRSNAPARQYWNRFTEVVYPNGEKSGSMILPGCVIYHEVMDFYGTPSVFFGVPQATVKKLDLKLSSTGSSGKFEDRKIMSDSKYWWTRVALKDAQQDQEYIRVDAGAEVGEGEDPMDYYASFTDFFADYPTSAVCNVTLSLKFKTDTLAGQVPDEKSEWRAAVSVYMITPYDAIEVSPPSTGIKQKSQMGAKDKAKPGLLKFKRS